MLEIALKHCMVSYDKSVNSRKIIHCQYKLGMLDKVSGIKDMASLLFPRHFYLFNYYVNFFEVLTLLVL